MYPLINVNHETFEIVADACKEQLDEGNYRRAFSLFITAYKIYRFLKKNRKQTIELINISYRIHNDAQKIREDLVDEAIDKILQ